MEFRRVLFRSVVLATLTTIFGFGSLMVARHAGIFSFGLLCALAVTCDLLAVFTVLPLLLRIIRLDKVPAAAVGRSEEHTSELQSLRHLVCRLLLSLCSTLLPYTTLFRSVVLATLTTIFGFGSLMVARHAGIFSFGLLCALAVTCDLLAVFTVLPLLLRIIRLDKVPAAAVG